MEERPLECSQCKNPPSVIYQEVLGDQTTVYQMCSQCPVLKKKLGSKKQVNGTLNSSLENSLSCHSCQTTLESVLLGSDLGCKHCYRVFQDVISDRLSLDNAIASDLKETQRGKEPFHLGKSPSSQMSELNANRLRTLSEALSEALIRENYEQAAWLRDQMDSLTKKTDEEL